MKHKLTIDGHQVDVWKSGIYYWAHSGHRKFASKSFSKSIKIIKSYIQQLEER